MRAYKIGSNILKTTPRVASQRWLWSLFQPAGRCRKFDRQTLVGRLMFGTLLAPRCKRAKDLVSQLHEKQQWSVSLGAVVFLCLYWKHFTLRRYVELGTCVLQLLCPNDKKFLGWDAIFSTPLTARETTPTHHDAANI